MTSILQLPRVPPPDLPPLIGSSAAIGLARNRIERFARTSLPVLLVGPTGSGKEIVARHLHALSGRGGELVDVNCGALPREMVESLLFGHRKGAFTGAIENASGFILRAHGGTLFLDELTSLPPTGQAALLRVLETGEVTPLGAPVKQHADFCLVAAVQEDVFARIERLQLRADLFYRVNGAAIHLPRLAARPDDIEPLAEHFAALRGCSLERKAMDVLRQQQWPGNVRELRTVVERACVLADGATLHAGVIWEALTAATGLSDSTFDLERAHLVEACTAHRGEALRIARALNLSRATLYRRLKKYGVRLAEFTATGYC